MPVGTSVPTCTPAADPRKPTLPAALTLAWFLLLGKDSIQSLFTLQSRMRISGGHPEGRAGGEARGQRGLCWGAVATVWAGEAGPLSRNQHHPVFTGKGRQQGCGSQRCVPHPGTHDPPEAGASLQVRKGGTWNLPRRPIVEGTPLPAEGLPQDRGRRRRKTGPESNGGNGGA